MLQFAMLMRGKKYIKKHYKAKVPLPNRYPFLVVFMRRNAPVLALSNSSTSIS